MKVYWSPRAAADLNEIVDFIAGDKPSAAVRVAERIKEHIERLALTPQIGRIGLVPSTRELVFAPWPYIAIYKVEPDAIRIIASGILPGCPDKPVAGKRGALVSI